MLSAKIWQESLKIAECPLHQLIHPGHLDFALSNPNIVSESSIRFHLPVSVFLLDLEALSEQITLGIRKLAMFQ